MRVIDGNDDYLLLKGEFAEMYNNRHFTVKEIQDKLKLTLRQYRNLRKECNEEGLITLRRANNQKKKKEIKNYSVGNRSIYGGGNFNVRHNGLYYCCCHSVQEAEMIVEKLRECDWDKSQVDRIKKEVKEAIK